MRSDMPKVVVERERLYGNTGYHHARAARKHDTSEEAPYLEGIRRPYDWDRKSLNENLSPLRGFLRSRVGQPWDKVYSEISKNLRPSSAVQQHVRDHVKNYVTLEIVEKSDGYYSRHGNRWERRLYKGALYVDKHGTLRVLKRDLPPKVKSTAQHFLITSLTEKTEKRRHVSKYKTTYYLHAKKSYQPMSGEVVEETIEASSYESALEYFKKGYGESPVKTFEKDHFGCNCLDCCARRSQPLALIAS